MVFVEIAYTVFGDGFIEDLEGVLGIAQRLIVRKSCAAKGTPAERRRPSHPQSRSRNPSSMHAIDVIVIDAVIDDQPNPSQA